MKKILAVIFLTIIICCTTILAEAEYKVKITVGETELTATFADNATSRALIEKMPMTLSMMDLYGREMCYRFSDEEIPAEEAQYGSFDVGKLLYWTPWHSFVIVYAESGEEIDDLQYVGMIDEGVEVFSSTGDADVTFELLDQSDQMFPVPDVVLNSGYTMPVIGLGTWTFDNDQAENSVYHALKAGMRLIDTARYYGCEVGVGRGIQKVIDEGFVTREQIFVTSKIMPGDYDRAAMGIDDSLRDMNLDYVDLMLIHQPGWNDEAVYRAMEQAVRDGKVHSIGISNYYTPEAVEEILSFAEIMPAVIQNENHLYYQNTALQEYVKQYGIVVESWYPFGGRGHTQEHLGNETIIRISEAHGKTPAQVILRWQIQAGFIAIPGSSNPDHIAENYDIFDFELTDEEMEEIRTLDRQERYESW